MTDQFTPEGIAKLRKGQLLVFDFEGSRNEFVVRNLRNGRVKVAPITTYSPDEVIVTDKATGEAHHLDGLADV